MYALVKATAGPGLTPTDWADPTPGPHDAVVKVAATSLCGTDVHIYRWDEWAQRRIHPPRIIGHELCGHVVEVGREVSLVKVGDYVAAESHLTCGACFQCRTGQAHVCKNYKILGIDRDGSYAQCVSLPEGVLWHTAPDIPPELACVQEPLGNAVDAALAEDLTGQTVLITGCGPTGLFAAAIARTAGAATIIATDVSDYRLGLAKKIGVDHVLNARTESVAQVAEAILEMTDGEGVDASLEMSGDPTALHQAFRAVKNGGRVTLFGIPTGPVCFDLPNEMIFKGIRVYGITGRRLFGTWYRLAGLFKAGLDIRPVVTHSLPLKEFAAGFELIQSGQCGKVVLIP
ncbi:L-threonine 3-dehydrogenase [Candidatus Nitrospira nitrificans]|uniref:Threonine 3-dehydrogenase, NAD(P)-binding n=1 Tax=Candidatus Nitrospira nitrificans TaxID=1742973 RepID=A0A0S4LFT8_9BACT|nr:L-threonine 3-dehydrogenase [Candidatus Nitrospira nitrificans]CUS36435.1 threonine 3-dehydrogenase, NAD(P)-binding [Candidatus Nitrospira nitrificans]